MTLIKEMTKYLDGDIRIISTYFDKISPCVDCRYCWKHEKCGINDGMQEIYELLNQVDNVILASPLYFSELTGSLLSVISRLQYYYVIKYIHKKTNFVLKKKNAVLIITGGGGGGPHPAIASANTIFRTINAQPIGTVESLKTDDVPAEEDAAALSKAKDLALQLNALYQKSV